MAKITIKWDADWEEFVVIPSWRKQATYHTNSYDDALGTAQAMANQKPGGRYGFPAGEAVEIVDKTGARARKAYPNPEILVSSNLMLPNDYVRGVHNATAASQQRALHGGRVRGAYHNGTGSRVQIDNTFVRAVPMASAASQRAALKGGRKRGAFNNPLGKGAYPFAVKSETYASFPPEQLTFALKDATQARDAMRGHSPDAEGYYADDVHTILAEMRRRGMRKNGTARHGKRGAYLNGRARARAEPDIHAANELQLYAFNDYQLYKGQFLSIAKNLVTKMARGTYDSKKAAKAFGYLAEAAAKKYNVEFGDGRRSVGIFDKPTRDLASASMAEAFEVAAREGEYDSLLPKKYAAKGTRSNGRRTGKRAAILNGRRRTAIMNPASEGEVKYSVTIKLEGTGSPKDAVKALGKAAGGSKSKKR